MLLFLVEINRAWQATIFNVVVVDFSENKPIKYMEHILCLPNYKMLASSKTF